MKPKLIIRYIGPLKGNQHYPESQNKKRIGLHHTAGGSAVEAVRWWNQTPDKVGTALLIERNGDALQCFEIAAWAYACGVGNALFEKEAVQIELVSYGFVIPDDNTGEFYAYPQWPLKNKRIKIPKDQVIRLDKPWRGFQFYHKYTDEQIETTVQLCRYLVNRFKIEIQSNLDGFWDYDPNFVKNQKKGLFSHTTVRPEGSGKWDIYPDPKLLAALKAEFNKPSSTRAEKASEPTQSKNNPVKTNSSK